MTNTKITFFISLCNSARPTQKAVCENQCTVNFNYSVILDQIIPCIGETVEEADTAPLFKTDYLNKLYMSRMKQLQRAYVDAHLYRSTRKEETSTFYTGNYRAKMRHANMICDVMLTSDVRTRAVRNIIFKSSHIFNGLFPEKY